MQRLCAVHLRHALIHQNQIVLGIRRQFHGSGAGSCRIDLHLGISKKIHGHRQIDLRVVHDEDVRRRCAERFAVRTCTHHIGLETLLQVAHRCEGNDLLRDRNGKDGALAVLTLHIDAAAHHVQKPLRNDQAEAGALDGTVMFHLETLELRKELFEVFRTDTDTRVRHRRLEKDLPIVLLLAPDRQPDRAPLRVLHGIVEDVRQDLADTHLVTEKLVRDRLVHVNGEIQFLVLGLEVSHVIEIVEKRTELIRRFHQVQPARFDLGKVEDVVNDGEKIVASALDVRGVNADVVERFLRGIRIIIREFLHSFLLTEDHLIHAQNGVDRRPDLMGHVREKITFGLVGALRPDLLLKQFALHLHIGTNHEEGQQRRHQLGQHEDDHITQYGCPGLGLQLSVEPVRREVDNDDAGYISVRIKDRAVCTVEFTPLVLVRHFVDRSHALARFCQRIGVLDRITVGRRTDLVEVHGENKLPVGIFLDAVHIFQFNIVTEDREGIVKIVVNGSVHILFLQVAEDIAADRARGAVCDIQHALLDGSSDAVSGAVNGNGAEQDTGDQQHALYDQNDFCG